MEADAGSGDMLLHKVGPVLTEEPLAEAQATLAALLNVDASEAHSARGALGAFESRMILPTVLDVVEPRHSGEWLCGEPQHAEVPEAPEAPLEAPEPEGDSPTPRGARTCPRIFGGSEVGAVLLEGKGEQVSKQASLSSCSSSSSTS